MSALEHEEAGEAAERRRRAVVALASDDGADRASRLLEALGDADWRVRKEAARVAGEVAVRWSLVPALVEALAQGEDVGLRNSALEVLERLGPRAASELLSALPRVPDTARKFVVAALGSAGSAGVARLTELSSDADRNTAQAAVEALARVGGPAAEAALRAHLGSDDPVKRLAALEGLERLEASLSFDAVEPLLADRLVRRLALRVLAFSDDPRAASALLAALDEPGPAAREAVMALGRLLERGGPLAREVARVTRGAGEERRAALRSMSREGDDRVQRAATWVLLLARDPSALGPTAERAAADALPPVALEAVRAWGGDAVEPLLAVASGLAPRARAAALEMASELAALESELPASRREVLVLALREGLVSEEPALAAASARAMSAWADEGDVAPLIACAARFPEQASHAAGRALERLARESPAALARALPSIPVDGPAGAALLPALALLGGAAASDRLKATLNADDPRARRAAVMVLARLGGPRALELARFALADDDVDVQLAAVHVLAGLSGAQGEPLGAENLRLALRAGFDAVVAAAARAIGAIGDRASLPVLRELVSEGRPGVSAAALESLRALEDPRLDDLLVEALGQPDEELVKEALRAIAGSGGPRRSARIALALEHPAWDVRKLAAKLLGEAPGEAAVAALAARLEREPDEGVRESIEHALLAARSGQ